MKDLEIKTTYKISSDITIPSFKKWISVESLKEFLNQEKDVKYTPYMVFEMLKKELKRKQ